MLYLCYGALATFKLLVYPCFGAVLNVRFVRYNVASGIEKGTRMTEDTAQQVCDSVLQTLLAQRKDRIKRGFYWENQIAFAFNSEKIEGGMLTEEQTRSIFETGTIVAGSPVPVDSVVEMRNHFRMFDLMLDTIGEPLTAGLIKRFHGVLREGEGAGEWKTVPNGVGGITTTAPADVGGAIERLLEAYGKRTRTTYRDIVGFHVFYERIHPFLDGNGRTGRIIMFRECLRGGLVPFIVLDTEKSEYYRAIRTFEDDGGERFVRFAEHMAELYLEEFSSLIPQNLLLPPLEEYVKHPSFDERDLSFFE